MPSNGLVANAWQLQRAVCEVRDLGEMRDLCEMRYLCEMRDLGEMRDLCVVSMSVIAPHSGAARRPKDMSLF